MSQNHEAKYKLYGHRLQIGASEGNDFSSGNGAGGKYGNVPQVDVGDLINMSGNTELSPYCGYGLCSSELVEPDRFILNVERFVETENSTISRFCFPDCTDGYFLEPSGPSSIIEGSKLRIMSGAYEVVPYSSAKYPNVLQLVGVPGRTKILTHIGNFPIDTKGCLLPGLSYSTDFVGKSRDAFEKLLYLHSSKTRFIINIY
jgi:hypothetical protein